MPYYLQITDGPSTWIYEERPSARSCGTPVGDYCGELIYVSGPAQHPGTIPDLSIVCGWVPILDAPMERQGAACDQMLEKGKTMTWAWVRYLNEPGDFKGDLEAYTAFHHGSYGLALHQSPAVGETGSSRDISPAVVSMNLRGYDPAATRILAALRVGHWHVPATAAYREAIRAAVAEVLVKCARSARSDVKSLQKRLMAPVCAKCSHEAPLRCPCKAAQYCSKECQVADWKAHSQVCPRR